MPLFRAEQDKNLRLPRMLKGLLRAIGGDFRGAPKSCTGQFRAIYFLRFLVPFWQQSSRHGAWRPSQAESWFAFEER
jgi:hypothetical protein